MLKSIMLAIDLMGEDITPKQIDKTMEKIKEHCSAKELDELIALISEENPIHEELKQYRQNMGYAGYY